MKVPFANRKKALLVIDVQPAFAKAEGEFALQNIQKLITAVPYDLYVESLFHCEEDSMWAKQTDEPMCPRDADFHTLAPVMDLLKSRNYIHIEKSTKSAFKGDKNLLSILQENGIQEVHLVGYDTDDCVFATANEAFDLGYFTYVIEECTASSSGNEMRERAIAIMRNVCITNNSCVEKIELREV